MARARTRGEHSCAGCVAYHVLGSLGLIVPDFDLGLAYFLLRVSYSMSKRLLLAPSIMAVRVRPESSSRPRPALRNSARPFGSSPRKGLRAIIAGNAERAEDAAEDAASDA